MDRSWKIHILVLRMWEQGEVFFPFLTQGYIIIGIIFPLNFNNTSYRLNYVFGKRSPIGIEIHILDIGGLEKLWSDFDNF